MHDFGARFSITDAMTPVLRKINDAIALMNENLAAADAATKLGMDPTSYRKVFELTQDINKELDEFEDAQHRIAAAQDTVTKAFKDSQIAADGLDGKLSSMLTAYAAFQAASKAANLSDTMTSVDARLNLISGGDTDGLQADIYSAAQDSRGNYMDMQSTVAKLGLMAGDKFDSNAEMVRFVELLNKNFIVGGAGSSEQSSAMFQLTQAMASGALQGDEYRSIIENAPLLAQAIEDYMRNVEGATGSMKEWASEGLLTADVIKNAMFYSADEVEQRFSQMPMNISQIGTVAYNSLVEKAMPMLEALNSAANWTYDNWDTIAIVVKPAAYAIGFYATAVGLAKAADFAATIVKGIKNTATIRGTKYTKEEAAAALSAAGAEKLSASAKAHLAVAAGTASIGQKLLNAAMYACPYIALIGGITALAGVLFNYGDSAEAATEDVYDFEKELEELEKKLAVPDNTNIELDVSLKLSEVDNYKIARIALAEWNHIQDIMSKPITNNVEQELQVLDYYLGDIKEKIPGIEDAEIAFDGMYASIKGVNGQMEDLIKNYADLAKTQAYIDVYYDKLKTAISNEISAEELLGDTPQYVKYEPDIPNYAERNALYSDGDAEYYETQTDYDRYNNAMGEHYLDFMLYGTPHSVANPYMEINPEYEQKYGEYIAAGKEVNDILDKLTEYMDAYAGQATGMSGATNPLTGIGDDVSTIAKTVTATAEDLKYLRDIAERETVNRFTTAEVMVNLGGITQNVSSESDLDGIVTYVADKLAEELQTVADGVHL